jgi:anti-sigma B factor antagonist
MDMVGARAIDSPLAQIAETGGNVVVDMNGVEFITSAGIRHLLMAAKAIGHSSGKLVLLRPNSLVTDVLFTTALEDLLPIARSEVEALNILKGH